MWTNGKFMSPFDGYKFSTFARWAFKIHATNDPSDHLKHWFFYSELSYILSVCVHETEGSVAGTGGTIGEGSAAPVGGRQRATPSPTVLLLLRVFVSAGTFLPSRCLATAVSFGSTISGFRRHITFPLLPQGLLSNLRGSKNSWWTVLSSTHWRSEAICVFPVG
jgi:hypothetical protein